MRVCTFFLTAHPFQPTYTPDQCGLPAVAVLGNGGLAVCQMHAAILLASLEVDKLAMIGFQSLNQRGPRT